MTLRLSAIALMTAVLLAASGTAPAKAPDRLTQMFAWWDGAFKDPNGFTKDAFLHYFDPDASLILNGKESTHGIDALTEHFKQIQAGGGEVEIVLPFLAEFQAGNKIFTHHIIRSRRNGKTGCMLVSGYATLRDNRILMLDLVRAEIDPATAPPEFKCWT